MLTAEVTEVDKNHQTSLNHVEIDIPAVFLRILFSGTLIFIHLLRVDVHPCPHLHHAGIGHHLGPSRRTFIIRRRTEGGGVGLELIRAECRLTRGSTVMRLHAATRFGDLTIGIATYWFPVTHQDRDEEEKTQTHRRHL